MTIKEIIDGLKFTVAMFLFDSSTGETFTEPRNDMDKITIDACIAAIELLEKEPRWIPVSERLPKDDGLYLVYTEEQPFVCPFEDGEFFIDEVLAWMPLPPPYQPQEWSE